MTLDEQKELARDRFCEYLEAGDAELAIKALHEFINTNMVILELNRLAEDSDKIE